MEHTSAVLVIIIGCKKKNKKAIYATCNFAIWVLRTIYGTKQGINGQNYHILLVLSKNQENTILATLEFVMKILFYIF